jgi:hypothetical protein
VRGAPFRGERSQGLGQLPATTFAIDEAASKIGKDLEMVIARGRTNTASGSKYLQQLCKHWGHRFEVEFSKTRGEVRFPSAIATLEASADALRVTLETEDAEAVERLKETVAKHLDRFAFREAPLPFEWSATEAR